jgi:hypothetical protein
MHVFGAELRFMQHEYFSVTAVMFFVTVSVPQQNNTRHAMLRDARSHGARGRAK